MSNFILDIVSSDKFILDIESGQTFDTLFIQQSNISVEDSQSNGVNLILESSYISDFGTIVIEKFNNYNLEICNVNGITTHFSGNIYMDDVIGDLHVSRISGLDEYLDSYNFDCGTP